MKQLLFLGFLFVLIGCSSSDESNDMQDPTDDVVMEDPAPEPARTLIPDAAFEASLVALFLDDEVDGSVITDNIDNVTSLVLNDQGIESLEGIEDFEALENLWANDNAIEELNLNGLTRLKFIFVDNNQVSEIVTSSLRDLEKLSLINNQMVSVDVTNNFALQILELSQNQLEAIDVASNPELTTFSIQDNPLTCIKASSEQINDIPETWTFDADDVFAISCD